MTLRFVSALAGAWLAAFLGGCASTPPQQPIALAALKAAPEGGRIGVAMAPLPKVDTSMPGAGCLLCLAAAAMANGAVTSYSHTLPYEDLPKVKEEIAERLRKKGADVIVIAEELKVESLPDTGSRGPDISPKNFATVKAKYGIERLVFIEIGTLGFERTYSGYVPTSDQKAVLRGRGYMVNLNSNAYEWYLPINLVRSSEGPWDESPKFPGLTNAYFQVVELGRDAFLQPFSR